MVSSASSFSFSYIPLQLKLLAFDAVEYLKVVCKYYRYWPFAKADFSLVMKGFVENPFRVARYYAEKRGMPDLSAYTYGETPLTTFEQIAKAAELRPGMTLIECGAGRGRVSLFAKEVLGCNVVAYETVPEFVKRLKRLGVEVHGDYFAADFSRADVIYLYGSTLSDEEIKRLGEQLKKAKKGSLFISTSWYLNEVEGTPNYSILKVLNCRFPWGNTNVYIQVKSD